MKFKNVFFILAFMLGCLFLTGCADQYQLSERLIVKGIGVDFSENEYSLTVQGWDFKNPKSKDQPNLKVVQVEGPSAAQALNKIQKQIGLTPLYSQNLIIVIGEQLASTGVNKFIDFFIRHAETRPRVKVCTCVGGKKNF